MRLLLVLFFPFFLFASWAELTLSSMTLEEKVGQLFVAPFCPLRGEDHRKDWETLTQTFHIGNVLVKQSDAPSQIASLTKLKELSKYPLLVAQDDEWGLAMTMSDAIAFPKNIYLGKVENKRLLVEFGKELGHEAKKVFVHLHLAPVADVNNNPENIIIGERSFGSDPENVANCVRAVIQGMHEANTLATVKHFPGHGDTATDSHYMLPVLEHNMERLEKVELLPFSQAIREGVDAIMTGHLLVLAIDPIYPATLSKKCIQELLREKLGFKGLVITDALNMKALKAYSFEEKALLAKGAGVDLLLYGYHLSEVVDEILRKEIPKAYSALLKAYQKGDLPLENLDQSVLRILKAKEKVGLHLKEKSLSDEPLFSLESYALQRKLEKASSF